MRFVSKRFLMLGGGAIVFAIIIIILLRAFTARAGVYHLYATSCLGGWENTYLASGAPDVKEGDSAIAFTADNSARLNPNTHAQIYCGGFTGDILESTIPQKILVRFSWMAELYLKPSLATETIAPAETPSTDNESIIAEIETLTLGTEAPVGNEPALSTNPAPMDLVSDITPELTQPESPQDPAPSDREPASLFESFLPIIDTEKKSVETAENAIKTTDIPTTTPPAELTPHGIVEVLYTLDGSLWKSLGFMERNEFGNKHFEIPIEEARDWEDISKIQIGIRSVPAIDRLAPIVYLDSVWIEVEYQVASEDPLIPPGEKEGDVILSEIQYENMIAVLVSRRTDSLFGASKQELWMASIAQEDVLEGGRNYILETQSVTQSINPKESIINSESPTATAENISENISAPVIEQNENLSESSLLLTAPTASEPIPAIIHPPINKMVRKTNKEWKMVADDFILSENPRIIFEDNNIFWVGKGDATLWSFNTQTNGYSSLSLSEGELARLYFKDEAGEERALEASSENFETLLIVDTPVYEEN